jgi:hypothetical protein
MGGNLLKSTEQACTPRTIKNKTTGCAAMGQEAVLHNRDCRHGFIMTFTIILRHSSDHREHDEATPQQFGLQAKPGPGQPA